MVLDSCGDEWWLAVGSHGSAQGSEEKEERMGRRKKRDVCNNLSVNSSSAQCQ